MTAAEGEGSARDARVASAESEAALVHAAVERFVELHSTGETPDLTEFVQAYPEALRPRILAQCREFLAFDGLLGHQEWEPVADGEGGHDGGEPGRTFGDFVITEELGRGGMGVVYLARQRSLKRRVALKVMASGLTLSKRHVERFRREAAATARLRHPAIVPVHSLEEVDGTFAIAMDYIAGRNLADILDDLRLANGPEPGSIEGTLGIEPEKGYVAECAIFCAEIASALSAAHQQGVMHRDLKPRNLMIDDRRQARLLDFGLSKSLEDGSISMSGEITGTVHYMSPEQTLAKRVPVDHRADVFALGVILYELLTLKRPFDGRNMQQIVYEICFKEPVSPQRLNHKVPRDLVTIVGKALEKDPSRRYDSAAELEADLQRFLRWEPIHARPASALSRLGKWVHRHRTETIAAAAVLAIAAGGLGWLWIDAAQNDAAAARLIQQAQRHEEAGDFRAAFDSATQALGRRDTPEIRAKIRTYQLSIENAAKQKDVDIAEAARLSLASKQAIEVDRELAVILALQAVERLRDTESPSAMAEARSAVLEALGSGFRTTALPPPAGQRTVCARWSPDGTAVVTAAMDPRVSQPEPEAAVAVVWNLDGTQRTVLRGHRHWIFDAAFTPDGSRVATASVDGTVRLWNLGDGSQADVWQHDPEVRRGGFAVQHVEFDAAGARALTHGYRAVRGPFRAQVWDVATGACLPPYAAHTKFVRAAAIAPDGRVAASYGDPDHVALWSAADGTELARLGGHRGRVTAIEFAPDGRIVAVAASDGVARLYSVPDGARLAAVAHSREITSLQFDRTGERLLTGSADMSARLWALRRDGEKITPREAHQFSGHTSTVSGARFDATGSFVVTGGADGTLRVFDAGSDRSSAGVELMRHEAGAPIVGAATFAPGADSARILAIAGRQPLIWELTDNRGVVTLRQPGRVPGACFDASGERVATAGDDEMLRLWDARGGHLLWAEDLGNPVEALDIDPAGDRIAASVDGGLVHVRRASDGELLFELAGHSADVPVVRFAADGTRLFTADEDGTAILWNANDQSVVRRIERPREIADADVSVDAARIATIDRGEDVARVWTVADGGPRLELGGHGATLRCVAFRPDGAAVLTGGDDGVVRVFDRAGTQTSPIETGRHPIRRAAWSRDGARILTSSASDRHRVRLWNAADGTEELRFGGHVSTVGCNAFSPDGRWAVSTSRDGTTHVWPTDPVAVARRLNLRDLTPAERAAYRLDRRN